MFDKPKFIHLIHEIQCIFLFDMVCINNISIDLTKKKEKKKYRKMMLLVFFVIIISNFIEV